jgi:hypothetical protein
MRGILAGPVWSGQMSMSSVRHDVRHRRWRRLCGVAGMVRQEQLRLTVEAQAAREAIGRHEVGRSDLAP